MQYFRFFALTPFALGMACGADPTLTPPVADEARLNEHASRPGDITDEPMHVIKLPGEEVRFYVDAYGSVGILGASETGVSVLDHPELDEAPPAVVFHALSTERIPGDLLTLHDDLVKQGEVAPLEEMLAGRTPAWAVPLGQAVSQPCRNSTFVERHCAHPSYASSVCWLNTSGAKTTWLPWATRFKAGYCLQEGSNWGYLYYQNTTNCGNHANFARHYVWGEGGPIYNATTYFTYVWWKPSTAPLRAWRHFSTSGVMTRDFASRYTASSCP